MKTIVVTGGIGSGKSVACQILHDEYGWPVYNADAKVKELYDRHPALLYDIETLAGTPLRDEQGNFVPSRLAGIIFSDSDMLEKVEALVFPALYDDYMGWVKASGDIGFALFESATILEKPALRGFGDYIILIDAPVDVRMKRAMMRDGVSSETLRLRMDRQVMMNDISDGVRVPEVDAVVKNDGDIEKLRERLRNLVGNGL